MSLCRHEQGCEGGCDQARRDDLSVTSGTDVWQRLRLRHLMLGVAPTTKEQVGIDLERAHLDLLGQRTRATGQRCSFPGSNPVRPRPVMTGPIRSLPAVPGRGGLEGGAGTDSQPVTLPVQGRSRPWPSVAVQ